MRRPRLYLVALACAGVFLGALGLARASDNSPEAASAPQPMANASASAHVTKLGHAATLPPMKTRRAARHSSAPAAPPPAPAPGAPGPGRPGGGGPGGGAPGAAARLASGREQPACPATEAHAQAE